jgi:hypothetical protein
MATRKRNVKTINRKSKSKTKTTSKYFMKGCSIKNKSLASKIKHRKTCPKCRMMRGGCVTCNMSGGGSLGFIDNFYNIGANAGSALTNFTNSVLFASPPLPSAHPTSGHFLNKYN